MSCLLLSYSFFDFLFILIILVNHGLSTAPQEPVQLLAWSKAKIENAGVGYAYMECHNEIMKI